MTLKGSKRLRRKLGEMTPELQKRLSKQLFAGAQDIRTEAIKGMQSSPPDESRTYTRRGVSHSASSPGRPPRVDTGALVNSISVKGKRLSYNVGSRSNAPYGKWLEFGTSNILPRPWLFPAFMKVRGQLQGKIAKTLKDGLRKVAR